MNSGTPVHSPTPIAWLNSAGRRRLTAALLFGAGAPLCVRLHFGAEDRAASAPGAARRRCCRWLPKRKAKCHDPGRPRPRSTRSASARPGPGEGGGLVTHLAHIHYSHSPMTDSRRYLIECHAWRQGEGTRNPSHFLKKSRGFGACTLQTWTSDLLRQALWKFVGTSLFQPSVFFYSFFFFFIK